MDQYFLGKFVVVRSYSAGVHAGIVESVEADRVRLQAGALRLWRWVSAFQRRHSLVAARGQSDVAPMPRLQRPVLVLRRLGRLRRVVDAGQLRRLQRVQRIRASHQR